MRQQTLFWIIGITSIIGLALAVESTAAHYAAIPHTFCNFNDTFDCGAVNRGPYSTFLGIPVAIFGLVGYIFFLISSVVYGYTRNELLLTFMGTAAIVGFAFTLYLIYLEAFVIYAWCIVCLGSALCMTILFTAIMYLRRLETKTTTPTMKEIHQ